MLYKKRHVESPILSRLESNTTLYPSHTHFKAQVLNLPFQQNPPGHKQTSTRTRDYGLNPSISTKSSKKKIA